MYKYMMLDFWLIRGGTSSLNDDGSFERHREDRGYTSEPPELKLLAEIFANFRNAYSVGFYFISSI
jgi:hypothetical protein